MEKAKVVIIGDENTLTGLKLVNLQTQFGSSCHYEQCLTMTTLMEALGRIKNETKHLLLDCLSNISHNFMLNKDMASSVQIGMSTIGEGLKQLVMRDPSLRIYVAQPISRKSEESKEVCRLVMRALSACVISSPTIWVLNWSTRVEVKPTGIMTEQSCKQFLEEFVLYVVPRMTRDRLLSIQAHEREKEEKEEKELTSTPKSQVFSGIKATPSIEEDSKLMFGVDEELLDDDVFARANETIKPGVEGSSTGQYASVSSVKRLEAKLVRHTRTMERYVIECKSKRVLDMLAFADQSERADFASNKLREDCVIVSGLRCKNFPKEIGDQHLIANEMMKDMVLKVLSREEPFSLTVRKVVQRKYAKGTNEVIVPPVEVKMTVAAAFEFRTKGANLARSKTEGFTGVYFGLSTTLATRIRCDILRILSKKINEREVTHDSYCIGNNLRPLLSYGPKGSKGGRRTFLYVEAVRKFANLFDDLDLSLPYAKAKDYYEGRMEHTFAVLRESSERPAPVSGSNMEGLGIKRLNSETPTWQSKIAKK